MNSRTTAIEAMRHELKIVLLNQAECVTDIGTVKNGLKYTYQGLVHKAEELRQAIKWLENMNNK